MPAKPKPKTSSRLANNRQAFHQYEILEKIEAGIVLTGAEVKSTRAHEINIKSGYASIDKGEVILKNCHISPYKLAHDPNYNPDRHRKLLLNRKEITHLEKQIHESNLALIPLSIFLKKGKIKVELGLGKGKKQYDKRHDLKRKDQELQMSRHFRNH
jgi:SsrA-binding protein